MAIATSIDALAIGVTFAFLETAILPAIGIIGCTTFCIWAEYSGSSMICFQVMRCEAAADPV